ncbi:MAG: prolipoprotein diacylglyceryl transferase [Oscillospiraceae bacterium]
MYTEISFPGLGISLNPSTGFTLGGLTIRWYGVVIALGLCLAVLYACRRSRQFGFQEDDILDGVLWVTPFAILCARAYYCAFSWEKYAANPISCLYIWEGGLAIYGGVIGAVIGCLVYCRIKKLNVFALLDLVCLGFLIGQCIGRWGNFFNREAFGEETSSFLRMGLYHVATGQTVYVHPTFLYESLWNLVGFLFLHFLSKGRKYDGQTALQYMAWYGAGRAVIEGPAHRQPVHSRHRPAGEPDPGGGGLRGGPGHSGGAGCAEAGSRPALREPGGGCTGPGGAAGGRTGGGEKKPEGTVPNLAQNINFL